MNFLAHLYLSFEEEEVLVGNFIADYVKGGLALAQYPAGIQRGIRLHRSIDSYTDQHPQIKEVVALLKPKFSRYAPVAADIYCDYLLVQNWDKYHPRPLAEFTEQTYAVLLRHREYYPAAFRTRVEGMIAHRWLDTYSTWEGIAEVFRRTAGRIAVPELFAAPLPALQQHFEVANQKFNLFFPELIQSCQQWLYENPIDSQ